MVVGPRPSSVTRRPTWWAAGLLYIALVVVHLDLALTMSGPVVYSDEGGYMGTARYLATGVGLLHFGNPYNPGYSVALLPLVWLFPAPLRTYQSALILNAALLAAVGVGIFVLLRHLVPNISLGLRLCASALVASYPSFLVYSNLVMSMNLFIPMVVAVCLAVGRAFRDDAPWAWLSAGAIGGVLYAVHPVGLLVGGLVLVAAAWLPRPRVGWWQAVAAVAAGLALGLIPSVGLLSVVQHHDAALAHPISGSTAAPNPAVTPPTPAPAPNRTAQNTRTLRANLSWARLGVDLAELAGQVFYLSVATYGVWVLGVVVSAGAAWRVLRRRPESPDALVVFIGMVMVATLALSVLRLSTGPPNRGSDELIYGRYNELVLAPFLAVGLVGLAQLRRASWRRVLATWAQVGAVILLSGAVLASGRTNRQLNAIFTDVNVFGLHPLLRFFGGIDITRIGLVGAGVALAVMILVQLGGLPAATLPVVVACVLAASFSANRLSRDSDGRLAQRVLIRAVNLISSRYGPAPGCVAYDIPVEHEWHLANDQFFLPRTRFRRFSSAAGQTPCSELVISARWDLDAQYAGARLMTPENFSPTKLWVMPGPLQSRLDAAGALLPPRFPAPLPAAAYDSTIRLAGVSANAGVVPQNGSRDIVLSVTHGGGGAPWPSRWGFTSGSGWVRLEVIWVAKASPQVPLSESSVDLPRTLFPGDTVDLKLRLTPEALGGGRLPAGAYVVRVGLVQDGFTFFTDRGDHTLDLDNITVVAAR